MNKLLGLFVALVAVGAGLAALYPDIAQQLVFSAMLKADVMLLKHWHQVPSTEQSLESLAVSRLLKRTVVRTDDVELLRKNLDAYGKLTYVASDVHIEQFNISRNDDTLLPAYWITPPGYLNKTIIVYLHGGGFVSGSFTSHRGLVVGLAARTGAKALFVDYRLAPEHPLPAAVDDMITAYKWLIYDQKVSAKKVVFMGDSAGGGLVLLSLLALQDEDKGTIPAPAAAVTLSAWTDLSGERPSYEKNRDSDVIQTESSLALAASRATMTRPEDAAARMSHKVSPIFAAADKLAKLPPLYMSVGSAEILLDDSVHFAGKAIQAGADVVLSVVPHMQHVFQFFYQYVPEADNDLTTIAKWVKKQQKHQ